MRDLLPGRDAELDAVDRMLDDVASGPAAVLLTGEAGIGKSTVWDEGVARARERGFTVLTCRPAAAEVRLSYTGLFDLLAGTDLNDIEELATPQRRALDAALLRGPIEDSSPDPRAVAAGFLSVLDGLAALAPTLLAIDDVQWLDEPTRRLVHHASRRCSGPVAMLIAERGDDVTDPDAQIGPIGPERRVVIPLGPLSLGALHEVVKLRTGVSLRWPAMVQITEVSAGNPYFAVELARSVDPDSARVDVLPDSLLATLRDRLAPLRPATVEALGVVSALADPRVELAARALEGGDVEDVLAPARAAGVVDVAGGRIHFTHPLLATAVYSEIAPSARRALHGRLSRVVDDAEERARHLALASVVADDVTTAALDEAAALARRRGAPDTAAELLERAISLGAADPRRRIDAADDHYRAGSLTRARQLLEEVIPELAPGALRARALARLGAARFEVDAAPDAHTLLERAVAEADDDLQLRASTAMELCWVLFHEGRCADSRPYAAQAVDDAERLGDDGLLAEALAVRTAVRFLLGHGPDETALARALQLEDPDRPTAVHNWPSYIGARLRWWTHRLDEARTAFAVVRKRCIDYGAESDLRYMDWWAVQAECAAGDIASAEALVDEHVERARHSGTAQSAAASCAVQAQLWAWVGRVDEARDTVSTSLDLLATAPSPAWSALAAGPLAMAELSVGNYDVVVDDAYPAVQSAIASGYGEPAALPAAPDAIEALVVSDRLDDVQPLVDWIEASGAQADRWWARAVGARCRGLLHAARGNADEAAVAFAEALAAHDRLPQLRYDRARTLLAAGRAERRRGRRRAAQSSLAEATELFDIVGAARWSANARAELNGLAKLSGRIAFPAT